MRHSHFFCLVSLFLASGALAKKKVDDEAPVKRDIRERVLTITDATLNQLNELHVAAGNPTSLVFEQPVLQGQEGTLLLNAQLFFPVRQTEKTVVVVPKKDLQPGQAISLTVTLADGTPLPFKLVTTPTDVDWQVRVTLALTTKAAPDSPKALKELATELQNKLEDCQSQAGEAGLRKVGQLILGSDQDKPEAFTVERRDIHWRDKQNRLLVTARQLYRLLGTSYLVLTIRNRDTKVWVLDSATVKLPGAADNTTSDVKVLDTLAQQASLKPDEEEKVVVVFSAPPQANGQKFDVTILEKNGPRHVLLEGLAL